MNLKRWLLAGAAGVVLVVGGYATVAASSLGDDGDQPLTGVELERAVAAALERTGGGTVTETEVGDDGAAYGVEVRLPDGRQVEVNLDQSFQVVGQEDDDGPDDDADDVDDD